MLATFSAEDVFRHQNAKHDLNQTIQPMSVPCSHYEQSSRLQRNQASAEGLLLMHRFARTELFRSSFFNRTVDLWNALPASTRKTNTCGAFKKLVSKFYFERLNSTFSSSSLCTWTNACKCLSCSCNRRHTLVLRL